MKKLAYTLSLFFVCLHFQLVEGKLLPNYPSMGNNKILEKLNFEKKSVNYHYPTEHQTHLLQKTLQDKIPEGIYVSLGADRGFQAASFFPQQITGLLLIDISYKVVLFNRINIAVLQMSSDLREYHHLRRFARFEDWQARKERVYSNELRELVENQQYYTWWIKENQSGFSLFFAGQQDDDDFLYYGTSNYFNNEDQFNAIHNLAKNDLIQAEKLNFSNSDALELLLQNIQSQEMPISVLDLSNLWQNDYLGTRVAEPIAQFKEAIENDDAVLLLTANHLYCPNILEKLHLTYSYFGFRFKLIKNSMQVEQFIAHFNTIQNSDIPYKWNTLILEN